MSVVKLAVYDLTNGMARQLSPLILGEMIEGIYHTGVIAFGKEVFFGGGIQMIDEGNFSTAYNITPNIIELGTTSKTMSELWSYLSSIRSQFTPSTYNLLSWNCNHFSNQVAQFLTNEEIPSSILNQHERIFSTPLGAQLRPMIEQMNSQFQSGGGGIPFEGGEMDFDLSQLGTTSSSSNNQHTEEEDKEEEEWDMMSENEFPTSPLLSLDTSNVRYKIFVDF